MSKINISTQELFLRLGSTPRSRSARADAVFRRLRFDAHAQVSEALLKSPRRLTFADIDGSLDSDRQARRR